jgi:DNA (cytosine-5)-methyltransferase 1
MTLLPERILSGEVEAPDVFCGGTPCQAFSVAGLRNSLDDARGNLSLTFVGIANAIDHVRSVRSAAPGIIFWENVPGVLSTKDNAFGCFLGALAGESDPLIPSGGKWTNAGCVFGPQRTVAWRVLDAQYFGVAQRRKRVFVVASARADFDPAAVLFEFDGVRRDTAPSRETGQAIAPCVTNGPPFSRTGNERVEAEAMVVQPFAVGNCLTARMHKGMNSDCNEGQTPVISIHPHCIGRAPNAGPQGKEYLLDGSAYCMDSRGHPQAIAIQDVTPREKAQNGRGWNDDGTAYTVDTHATQGVAQPIPINSMNAFRSADADPTTGCGIGEAGEAMFTITKGNSHAVAQPIAFSRNDDGRDATTDLSPTMRVAGRAGGMLGVAQPIVAMRESGLGYWMEDTVAGTLDANMGMSGHANRPAVMTVPQAMAVRRLTPVECERLQGFPDGYTNIPWRKKDESPDGPRYKALGNSWAVPVVRWIGNRIQQEINK